MTSQRKMRANRQNARASTGPKTASGKARASANARQHGLATPTALDDDLEWHADRFVREVTASCHGDDPRLMELARQIATSEAKLLRVRQERHQLLRKWPETSEGRAGLNSLSKVTAGQLLEDMSLQMERLDRYERRALSKRDKAIELFNAVLSIVTFRAGTGEKASFYDDHSGG